MFKQFDQVRIITTRNVRYLSAPPGVEVDPHGIWSVSAIVGNELLLVKNNVVIRIPDSDVLKIFGFQFDVILGLLGRLTTYGEEDRKNGKTIGPTELEDDD